MVPVLLVALMGLSSVGAVAAMRLRATPGPDGQRAAIVSGAVGLELLVSIGLIVVAAQALSDGDVLCPVDAQCSAPSAWPALVMVPTLVIATIVGRRVARRRRWPVATTAIAAVAAVAIVIALVIAGSTYRIDVPRP